MKKSHIMENSFYAGIVYHIETLIHEADLAAQEEGIELKDSHIKSCLSKVKILARGQEPKTIPRTSRDNLILILAHLIDGARDMLCTSRAGDEIDVDNVESEELEPLDIRDWLLAVKAVEESLTLRTMSGTRYYLDFLKVFLEKIEQGESKLTRDKKWWKRIFHKD